jgi:hypothetical protein
LIMGKYILKNLFYFYVFLIIMVMAAVVAGITVNIKDIIQNPEFYTSAPDDSCGINMATSRFWPVVFIMIIPVISLAGALVLEFRSDRSTSWFIVGIMIYLVFNYFLAASGLFK